MFNHLIGFPGADPSVPLYAFVFLVALGIDYNIFLMSRVREESLRVGTRKGVLEGLVATGGVITSAGIVLAATFAALAVIPVMSPCPPSWRSSSPSASSSTRSWCARSSFQPSSTTSDERMVAMAEADSTRRVIRAPFFGRCLVVTQRKADVDDLPAYVRAGEEEPEMASTESKADVVRSLSASRRRAAISFAEVLASITEAEWSRPTPAKNWTTQDQIAISPTSTSSPAWQFPNRSGSSTSGVR